MAQVIEFKDVLGKGAKPGRHSSQGTFIEAVPAGPSGTSRQLVARENIFRAILLLDLAAQQTRVLMKNIADPARRSGFEAQIVVIEGSLQHARDLALKI